MTYYIGSMSFSDGHDILHYGVKGMKWGIRNEKEPIGGGGHRRLKAQKMQDRILRQTKKLDRYKEKIANKASKKIARKMARLKDPEKRAKLKAELDKKLASVRKMSVKDMNSAKIRKGLSILGGILGGGLAAAAITLTAGMGAAIGIAALTSASSVAITLGSGASAAILGGGAAIGATSAAKRSTKRTIKRITKKYN